MGALKGRPYKELGGEFIDGRIVVLLAADFAVVFG